MDYTPFFSCFRSEKQIQALLLFNERLFCLYFLYYQHLLCYYNYILTRKSILAFAVIFLTPLFLFSGFILLVQDVSYTYAYRNRGIVYRQLGDINKAREDFQRSAELYFTKGDTADYQEAIELLNSL
jgi:tetratricopeptide (TPR) repeat protein